MDDTELFYFSLKPLGSFCTCQPLLASSNIMELSYVDDWNNSILQCLVYLRTQNGSCTGWRVSKLHFQNILYLLAERYNTYFPLWECFFFTLHSQSEFVSFYMLSCISFKMLLAEIFTKTKFSPYWTDTHSHSKQWENHQRNILSCRSIIHNTMSVLFLNV